jgi:3-hydroxyisobutyrate dehydrogenase-like beta-hydroxyacid dehydrogenase
MSGRSLALLGLGVMGFPMPVAVLAWRWHLSIRWLLRIDA